MPENKDKINLDGCNLHRAAVENRVDIAYEMIGSGCDVNAKVEDGATPLHLAARYKSLEVATLLVECGADVNAKVEDGSTPLHRAAEMINLEIARLLIDNAADVNAKDEDGATPLQYFGSGDELMFGYDYFREIWERDHEEDYPDHLNPFSAVKSLEMARLLIKHGAVVNADNCKGPMIHAAKIDSVELAELLIDKGVDVNAIDDHEFPIVSVDHEGPRTRTHSAETSSSASLLHYAVMHGSLRVVRLLLSHDADVNARTIVTIDGSSIHKYLDSWDEEDQTPLFYAVDDPRFEGKEDLALLVEELIQHGADVNVIDESRMTALGIACHRRSPEVVRILIENGANVTTGIGFWFPDDGLYLDRSSSGSLDVTALDFAIAHKEDELVELILEKNVDLQLGQALHYAIEIGSSEFVKRLIHEDLQLFGHIRVDKKQGNTLTSSHLRHVVSSNATDVLRLLIDMGVDVDFDMAMRQAAIDNNHLHANLLLQNDVQVSSQDFAGNSPLHYAAVENSMNVARLLIRSDANRNARNWKGRTPLFYAAICDSLSMANLLIENDEPVDTLDDSGNTVLHFAAKYNSVRVARMLIARGACVNKVNDANMTPLQEARRASAPDMEKLLIDCKADTVGIDRGGMGASKSLEYDERRRLWDEIYFGSWNLLKAVDEDRIDIARTLIEVKQDPEVGVWHTGGITFEGDSRRPGIWRPYPFLGRIIKATRGKDHIDSWDEGYSEFKTYYGFKTYYPESGEPPELEDIAKLPW